uniref:STAS domain-containing protein n=1 Tax=Kitasatospora indigofera TaxID=67307 RepID=UPI002F91BC8D
MAAHPRQLDVDLTAVTFCDLVGLRALLRTRHAARTQDTGFRLTGIHPHLLTLLHATDLLPPG